MKAQKDTKPEIEKKYGIIGAIVLGILILIIVISVVTSNNGDSAENTEKADAQASLVSKVQKEIDAMDEETRTTLSSTSQGGYQGDVVKVEPAVSDDTVKITVSTYFKDTGDEVDGGRNIAKKLFGIMCIQIPELNSVYVTSEATGLESRSVYRSQIPACKAV